jgi:hypothetical protein
MHKINSVDALFSLVLPCRWNIMKTIKAWTHFTFPGRNIKYSKLEWLVAF